MKNLRPTGAQISFGRRSRIDLTLRSGGGGQTILISGSDPQEVFDVEVDLDDEQPLTRTAVQADDDGNVAMRVANLLRGCRISVRSRSRGDVTRCIC